MTKAAESEGQNDPCNSVRGEENAEEARNLRAEKYRKCAVTVVIIGGVVCLIAIGVGSFIAGSKFVEGMRIVSKSLDEASKEIGKVGKAVKDLDLKEAAKELGLKEAAKELGLKEAAQNLGLNLGLKEAAQNLGLKEAAQNLGLKEAAQNLGLKEAAQNLGLKEAAQNLGLKEAAKELGLKEFKFKIW